MIIYNPKTNKLDWSKLKNIPEIYRLNEIPQNEKWHKEGNAYIHTCAVTQAMIDYINFSDNPKLLDEDYRQILVFAALFHDIGKYKTTYSGEDGLYHCPNHAQESINIINEIFDLYDLGIHDMLKDSIISLVRYHMHPLYLSLDVYFTKKMYKLMNKLNKISFEELLILKRCDIEGSINDEIENSLQYLDIIESRYKENYITSGCKVKIKKIKSLKYQDGHPNDINEGYIAEGILFVPVTIGWRTYVGKNFSTSPVTKIIDKNHFQTENSIYEIIELE